MAEGQQRGFEDLECYQLALKVMQEGYSVIRYVRTQKQGHQEYGNGPLLRESPPFYLVSHDPVEDLAGEDDQSTNLPVYPLQGEL
jgi:hypothetical protein